jgi:hypothetical protein
MVFEVLPGNILSDLLKRFDYQTQAEEWAKKQARDWFYNTGAKRTFIVDFHGMKVNQYTGAY